MGKAYTPKIHETVRANWFKPLKGRVFAIVGERKSSNGMRIAEGVFKGWDVAYRYTLTLRHNKIKSEMLIGTFNAEGNIDITGGYSF